MTLLSHSFSNMRMKYFLQILIKCVIIMGSQVIVLRLFNDEIFSHN